MLLLRWTLIVPHSQHRTHQKQISDRSTNIHDPHHLKRYLRVKIRSTYINEDSNATLPGGIFLKQYTVIFDKQHAQIGFVPFPVIQQYDYLTPEVLNILVMVLFCCGIISTAILFIKSFFFLG